MVTHCGCPCCAVQGVRLSSTDGSVFLLAGTDGSLILFNTANFATYGATPAAEIWTSGSAGAYSGTSYLSMQSVSSTACLACLHRSICRRGELQTCQRCGRSPRRDP